MRRKLGVLCLFVALIVMVGFVATGCAPQGDVTPALEVVMDPLPSWNEGAAKQSIVDFIARVTNPASQDFVPEAERIATFDNDGTLWAEQPLYFQLFFTLDRVKALADEHPEWRSEQPFKAILEDDREALAAMGHAEIGQILAATHTGMTAEEFSSIARQWLDTSRHPRFDRPFDTCIYQPMVEVLEYLRANGFTTFIASAGGIEFMRTFAEEAYGIPRHQVIGSSVETEFHVDGERSFLMRLPEAAFIDDRAAKPVAINRHIGRRPIAAFGNSDGDLQMLQWTAAGDGPSFCLYVHHTDADREWAYDRDSHIGGLDKGLDEAAKNGWTVVDMKNDWMVVYPWN